MAEFDHAALWDEALKQLKSEIGETAFSEWFVGIAYLHSGENSLTIGFPSTFHIDNVKKKYHGKLISSLREIAGREIALEFIVSAQKYKKDTKKEETLAGTVREKTPEYNTAKEPARTVVPLKKDKRGQHEDLRDDYSFDKYVIGENNKFAANAAKAISNNPGTNYNPLFIYGGVGLGKTHLMQAIGNFIHENSERKVIYVTSENFINEFTSGIKEGKMKSFQTKYRRGDVLLIDDIQFLADKPGTQDELFHTFNTMMMSKNQVVFTCDRPPSELRKFEERLISRFEQGLKVDLQPPRYEERLAILESTAESRGISMPHDVLEFISKKISSNVRDLLGALNKLIAFSELMKSDIDIKIAQHQLRDTLAESKQTNLSMETIQKVVASHFNISVNDLKGKKRTQTIVFPRQLAMHICREMTEFSSTEIGEAFGGKDHSTVIHSLDKIRKRFTTDPNMDSTIDILKRQIKEMGAKL
jgi:chromosomal replication initiator protein